MLGKVIPVAGSEIVRLLVNFNAHLQRTLSAADDGPLRGGDYVWGLEQDYNIRVGNANNHQCTYGVMRAAVAALYDYMLAENDFGTVKFDIWDGENQVGQGIVESTAAFPGLL